MKEIRVRGRLITIGASVLLGIGLVCGVGMARAHQAAAQLTTRDLTNFNAPEMGIKFNPVGGSSPAAPTLPSGKAAIGLETALAAAGKHSMASIDPRQIPGVQYIARYGVFTDDQLHQVGTKSLAFVNRPVWVIRYYGSGVIIPMDGPDGLPPRYSHDVTVVIDAATGEHLETYIG